MASIEAQREWGVVRTNGFIRCRRANVGQLLTFSGFTFKIVLRGCVSPMIMQCKNVRPAGPIIILPTLLQGSTGRMPPRYRFPLEDQNASRDGPGSELVRCPANGKTRLIDACNACFGQDSRGNRSARAMDIGHDAGFTGTGGFISTSSPLRTR